MKFQFRSDRFVLWQGLSFFSEKYTEIPSQNLNALDVEEQTIQTSHTHMASRQLGKGTWWGRN